MGLVLASLHLRHALRERSGHSFMNQVAMTDAMSHAVLRVTRDRRMRVPEVMDALLTTLVSFVQSQAPHEEWDDVGAILAEEMRRRMTVTGDTGDDHHARRMI